MRKEIIEKFREYEGQPEDEILKKNWRSITCMACAVCCCSSVIPIAWEDFEAFYGRLVSPEDLPEFAAMFLQNPDPEAANHAIETYRHGGRCMFLSKGVWLQCDTWDTRPDVCRDFFCWEMTCFDKWMNGDEQDMFGEDGDWMTNYQILQDKIDHQTPQNLFPGDLAGYIRLKTGGEAPARYRARRREDADMEKVDNRDDDV